MKKYITVFRIVIVIIVVTCVCALIIAERKYSRQEKECNAKVIVLQLSEIEYSIKLYHLNTNNYPSNIDELVRLNLLIPQNTHTKSGEKYHFQNEQVVISGGNYIVPFVKLKLPITDKDVCGFINQEESGDKTINLMPSADRKYQCFGPKDGYYTVTNLL